MSVDELVDSQVTLLNYLWAGWDREDICEALDITASTYRIRVMRIRRRLQADLDEVPENELARVAELKGMWKPPVGWVDVDGEE